MANPDEGWSPHLRDYAAGVRHDPPTHIPPHQRQKVLARRRRVAQQLLLTSALAPRDWPDYRALLQFEIEAQINRLRTALVIQWHEISQQRPELTVTLTTLRNSNRGAAIAKRDPELYESWLKGLVIKEWCRDLRKLGTLEKLAFGESYYGYDPDIY